ncbi:Transcription factor TGA like domain [Dillenia turbinata]|uniref:Transcription factor TGA like domain n=1 Tax=Dillenia turbinata TaxID=194707 RepID=A0AAN8ZR62_9MAGN
MCASSHDPFCCRFNEWINQQHQDLQELLHASTFTRDNSVELRHIGEKCLKHFEDYLHSRVQLAKLNAPQLFSPSYFSSFEQSFLWIGGCRPTLALHLVYSLCGSQLKSQLPELCQGERKDNIADISADQLNLINSLHCKTVKEEEKLESELTGPQEKMAKSMFSMVANHSSSVAESSGDVDRALDAHSKALAGIVVDADNLRMSTLKELMNILTPLQLVDLLVASKKLHLSFHGWAQRRENHNKEQSSNQH